MLFQNQARIAMGCGRMTAGAHRSDLLYEDAFQSTQGRCRRGAGELCEVMDHVNLIVVSEFVC